MYTGIVETTASIRRVERGERGARVRVATDTAGIDPGDSVAVSGVCLTAEDVGEGWFEAALSADTLDRTYLASPDAGAAVNVERPLPADGRFDGHLVKGTVDTTTEIDSVTTRPDDWRLTVAQPAGYERYVVEKGAVALDGISLTITAVDDDRGTFSVAIVPETRDRTTLSSASAGDRVHFEADVVAKYVQRGRTVAAGPEAGTVRAHDADESRGERRDGD